MYRLNVVDIPSDGLKTTSKLIKFVAAETKA